MPDVWYGKINSAKAKTTWGRILGRNPDKSLKSFPPCYSQSSLQLCLEIYISSNSRNLLKFLQRKRRKTWLKTLPPSLCFMKSIQKPQVWELSRLCPETSVPDPWHFGVDLYLWLMDPDSGSGSCYFRHWPSRCQQKTILFKKFFCSLPFEGTFTSFFKDNKKVQRSHKTVGIKVFLTIFSCW